MEEYDFHIIETRAVLKHPKLLKTIKNLPRTNNLYMTCKILYFRCRAHDLHFHPKSRLARYKNLEVLDDFQFAVTSRIFGVMQNPGNGVTISKCSLRSPVYKSRGAVWILALRNLHCLQNTTLQDQWKFKTLSINPPPPIFAPPPF